MNWFQEMCKFLAEEWRRGKLQFAVGFFCCISIFILLGILVILFGLLIVQGIGILFSQHLIGALIGIAVICAFGSIVSALIHYGERFK